MTNRGNLKQKCHLKVSALAGEGLAKRELEQDKFEDSLQLLPESAKVLLKFARERGLLVEVNKNR
jgi:hypothetical protein